MFQTLNKLVDEKLAAFSATVPGPVATSGSVRPQLLALRPPPPPPPPRAYPTQPQLQAGPSLVGPRRLRPRFSGGVRPPYPYHGFGNRRGGYYGDGYNNLNAGWYPNWFNDGNGGYYYDYSGYDSYGNGYDGYYDGSYE